MPAFRVKFGLRAGAAAFAAVATIAISGAPAHAQFFGYWGAPPQAVNLMPAPLVYRRLQARGFEVVAPLQRNGGVYLADVRDRFGHRRRLVLDAYSGAILQSFAYGPPRPPAGIPAPRAYSPEPAYASRYAPESLPSERPGVAPAPGATLGSAPYAPPHESRPKRPPRKIARREVAPSKLEHSRPEPTPSEATREPGPPPSAAPGEPSAPLKAVETKAPASHSSGSSTPAVQSPQEAEATAQRTPAAKPTPAKPESKPANRPGYANGVPINPLD